VAEETRQAIIRGSNLRENEEDLKLKEKAERCDRGKVKNADPGHFERMYYVIYTLLSPSVHLNIEGLDVFVSQNELGKYSFNDGDDGNF